MFNLANLFTAANLISGCLAVVFALSGRLDLAPFAVFTGLIFDFLDGFAARLFKTSGEMGKQLDSLADMITFGVAPGVIMLYVLAVLGGDLSSGTTSAALHQSYLTWFSQLDVLSLKGNFVPFIALVLPFFSLFRLAKFNLDTRQSESFIGLPTPSMTLFFMSFPLVLTSDSQSIDLQYILFNPWVIVALMLMLGIMMISEVALFSLKLKQFGWHGNQLRIVFLLISLVFILLFKAWSFSLIVFLYLILSMIENTFFKKVRNEV